MSEEAKYKKEDNILVRLARSQEEVRVITQDVEVQMASGGYMGVSAAQVVALAKRVLIDNGILYYPCQDQSSYHAEGNMRRIWVDGHFVNLDDAGDCLVSGSWGEGADRSDKGLSKAFTNANKNILSKLLQMTTLEDDSGDHEGVNKDGTDGKTKGDKHSPKGTPHLSPAESLALCEALVKKLPAAPMTPAQGEKFATENASDLNRLLQGHADDVRREFAARRKKK